MICTRCLIRAQARAPIVPRIRNFTSRAASRNTAAAAATSPRTAGDHPAATSTSAAQPFSTPLTPGPNPVSTGADLKPKSIKAIPVSSVPAGTALKGLSYIKGRDDPIALPESEYPEWLWEVLEVKKSEEENLDGDEFCMF